MRQSSKSEGSIFTPSGENFAIAGSSVDVANSHPTDTAVDEGFSAITSSNDPVDHVNLLDLPTDADAPLASGNSSGHSDGASPETASWDISSNSDTVSYSSASDGGNWFDSNGHSNVTGITGESKYRHHCVRHRDLNNGFLFAV